MNRHLALLSIVAVLVCLGVPAAWAGDSPTPASQLTPAGGVGRKDLSQLRSLPIRSVQIREGFWAERQRVIRDHMLPSNAWQYAQCSIDELRHAATPEKKPVENNGVAWESVLYKVMETAALSLAQEPNPALERHMDEVAAIIAAAQQPDGYVHAHIVNRRLKPWGESNYHDGYVAGHLIEAAIAYYQATGKSNLLQTACRAADEAWQRFVVQKTGGFSGHQEFELALVDLARVTGQTRYLDLARALIERRGVPPGSDYEQEHAPIRQQSEIRGHAVRAVFFASGVADAALETGDADYRAAALRLWESATKRKMYITGSVGLLDSEAFGPDYRLKNDLWGTDGAPDHRYACYAESCAACGLADLAQRVFLLERSAEAIDVLERVLYNGLLHGIALDGMSYYYVNPLTDARKQRDQPWLCCPPNLSRTILKVGRYAYAHTDHDIYVNLYLTSQSVFPLGAGPVRLDVVTAYPWEGKVNLKVQAEGEPAVTLHLRIPGWCEHARLAVNGEPAREPITTRGYAMIQHRWRNGDSIELDLPMPVLRMEANPLVKYDAGRVAIQRGPIVYGVEGLDNDGTAALALGENPRLQAAFLPNFLSGMTVIKGVTDTGRALMAIPFFALANRRPSTQEVWLNQVGKTDDPRAWEGRLYRPYQKPAPAPNSL
jgi:uncharacterized protein